MRRFSRSILKCVALFMFIVIMFTPVSAITFTDVYDYVSSEEFDSIMYVSDNGYMVGNGDGTFSPSNNVTRAEFVQTLYAFSGKPTSSNEIPFMDVSTSAWYYSIVTRIPIFAVHFQDYKAHI